MNTPQDRGNRIAAWGTRGRDLLWIMTMLVVTNLVTFALIGAGYQAVYLPVTVFIVLMTLLGVMGCLDAMDDIAAVAEDADEEERQTVAHKRFVDTQWMGFKVLIALGFGLTALANIAVMWVL